jgi:putative ATP-binding cassette transporter
MKLEPAERVPFNRKIWDRFVDMVKRFTSDPEVGWTALLRFGLLILFLFGINGLNVVNSYVGRDFMTAIADRDKAGFVTQALNYLGVFAALTAVAVISRYTEESLGLLWREWLTRLSLSRYLEHKNYYRLGLAGELGNPDQRIADDVRTFTATVIFDETVGFLGRYDAVLELLADGRWRWSFVENGRMAEQKQGGG